MNRAIEPRTTTATFVDHVDSPEWVARSFIRTVIRRLVTDGGDREGDERPADRWHDPGAGGSDPDEVDDDRDTDGDGSGPDGNDSDEVDDDRDTDVDNSDVDHTDTDDQQRAASVPGWEDWNPESKLASDRTQLLGRLGNRVDDDRVIDAMATVPRHRFVPPDRRESAYRDRPLPIGDNQTISAPHMVAIMADLIEIEPGDRVLEIGTGCGYHAAVTAELVGPANVYSVEFSDSLAAAARDRLTACGYEDVTVVVGDGREGIAESAPFDAVYATCALETVPDAVCGQLRVGGRFLGPIGTRLQTLVRVEKRADGEFERSSHGAVRFVSVRG